MKDYAQKAKGAMIATRAGLLALVGIIIVSTLWLVPVHKSPNPYICVLSLLPIMMLVPWIVKKNIRAHIWLCFVLLGYFLNAVQSAFMPEYYGFLPFVEILVLVFLFIASMLFARWQKRTSVN